MEKTKKCNKCNQNLAISEFHKSKDNKFGVKAVCKNCCNKQHRLYYWNNLEKVRKQNRIKANRNYKNNPELIKTEIKNFRKTKKGKEMRKRERLQYKIKNPKKTKAVQKLNDLLKYYISNNEFWCTICGKQPIEKHHENYDEPFVFIPLCKEHHTKIHTIKGV